MRGQKYSVHAARTLECNLYDGREGGIGEHAVDVVGIVALLNAPTGQWVTHWPQ